jgi:PhzF family phenazine biosynthesis protein
MKLSLYQIDAFATIPFTGNPAAVVPLTEWLPDAVMQNIAMENNLAETAFFVPKGNGYELRWFTPNIEVDLCGHATLASAYVLFNHEGHEGDTIHFHSPRSGPLSVTKKGDLLTLNFPADAIKEVDLSDEMAACFDIAPTTAYKGKTDFMLVYDSEQQIRDLTPYFDRINALDARGVIVTAPGNEVDFVSRFFAPQCAVPEDPVTGSAHTTLTPYWAKRLGKDSLSAMQLSERTGRLQCTFLGDRVEIAGEGRLYLIGEIYV